MTKISKAPVEQLSRIDPSLPTHNRWIVYGMHIAQSGYRLYQFNRSDYHSGNECKRSCPAGQRIRF